MGASDLILKTCASVLSPAGARSRLAILIYHRVLPAPDEITGEVDAATFDAHLAALRAYFNVLPLSEAVERLHSGALPPRAAAITFDDGYADNLLVALPILQRHRLHATFFIANGYLDGGRMFNDTVIEAIRRMQGVLDVPAAGLHGVAVGSLQEKRAAVSRVLAAVKYFDPGAREQVVGEIAHAAGASLPADLMLRSEQLQALARSGMEIGGHTVNHPILARVPTEVARREITENRRALQALTGQPIRLFAYPNGAPGRDYAAEHVELAREAGYAAAVSTSWGAATRDCDLFQLPRFTPWDRAPRRFALRLLHNLVGRRPVQLPAATVPALA